MAHRDIGLTLFKVAYRIATRGHHIAQQLVGVCYCATWAVNEPRLDSAPGLDKPRTIARSERPDVQALHSVCALVEHRFRFPPAPAFLHGAGIFSATKLSAQSFRPAFSNEKPDSDACDCHQGHSDRDSDLRRAYF